MGYVAGAAGMLYIVFAALKVHPKAQALLLVLVGAGVGGFLGEWIDRLAAAMIRVFETGSGWAFGAGFGWGLALAVVTFWVIVFLPNSIEPVDINSAKWIKPTFYVASVFLWPCVLLLFGGLATLAAVAGV